MDAVKFLDVFGKTCAIHNACRDCPFSTYRNGRNLFCADFIGKYPEEAVSIAQNIIKPEMEEQAAEEL